MRLWACLIALGALATVTSQPSSDPSHVSTRAPLGPPHHVDPWAKRFLKALSSAGDLSSYYQDDENQDFVFPARFKQHHSNRNLCHGKLMAEDRSPLPPRSFYGWDQDYCEWLTALSYAKMTPEQQQTYVKDPTIFYFRVPEDDELFLYTEKREVLEQTMAEILKTLPENRAAEWNSVSKEWKDKAPAVKLVHAFCEMMEPTQNLWPARFRGTINRLPLSGELLITMGEAGAKMELEDDDNPIMTDDNRLEKVAAFYKRYANENAQRKMAPWITALSQNKRADNWVSNTQLEVTLCKAPEASVGSMKIKAYQQSGNDITQIYPESCATLWDKESASIHDEPVILDYGAAMKIGKKCGKNEDEWCKPTLFGKPTAEFQTSIGKLRESNLLLLQSLKKHGRGRIIAEYNALIDQIIGMLVIPDWLTDVQVVELRIMAKRVLDILDPPPVLPTHAPPPPPPPMYPCCCCMGCQTCCGNPIGKLQYQAQGMSHPQGGMPYPQGGMPYPQGGMKYSQGGMKHGTRAARHPRPPRPPRAKRPPPLPPKKPLPSKDIDSDAEEKPEETTQD